MQYKAIDFFGEKLFFENKHELFNFIDRTVSRWSGFSCHFTYDFKVTNNFCKKDIKQSYLVEKIETNKTSYAGRDMREHVYVNARYIILDVNGFKINLTTLEEEYVQSRYGKIKKRKRYNYISGTKYNSRAYKKTLGIINELKSNVYADEEGIALRKKRKTRVDNICYDRWNCSRHSYEATHVSWKKKRKKKQWL